VLLLVLLLAVVVGALLLGNSGSPPGKSANTPAPEPRKPPREFTNSLGMTFVRVPRGTFWMGWDSENKKSQQMEVKNDFYLGVYTVTQGEWQALMGDNPSYFQRGGPGDHNVEDVSDADLKRFPVEMVSWRIVQEFIRKLNVREKNSGWTYRLPTGEEWEYACRGGATSQQECSFDFYLSTGPTNDLSWNQANFDSNKPLYRTTNVGSYPPNKLGLYDMHGNVFQWCQGECRSRDEDGTEIVLGWWIRGGSWRDSGRFCWAAWGCHKRA